MLSRVAIVFAWACWVCGDPCTGTSTALVVRTPPAKGRAGINSVRVSCDPQAASTPLRYTPRTAEPRFAREYAAFEASTLALPSLKSRANLQRTLTNKGLPVQRTVDTVSLASSRLPLGSNCILQSVRVVGQVRLPWPAARRSDARWNLVILDC